MMVRSLLRQGKAQARRMVNRGLNAMAAPQIVLLYHRVTDLAHDPEQLAVSPQRFRDQMRFLKQHYAVRRFEEPAAGDRSVVVTFDDGYADNLLEALPILEECGVPATFFISTGTIGTDREFWWDELGRLILLAEQTPEAFVLDDPEFGRRWATASREERQVFYQHFHPLVKQVAPARREQWLDQVRAWAGRGPAGRPSHRPLTVAELQRLADSPLVTIGAHTVTHTALSSLPAEAQREELRQSREQLEAWLGRPVTTFSYPFGSRWDYNAPSVELVQALGFVRVASNFAGQVRPWTSPYEIPRHLVRNWELERFARELEACWTK